MSDIPNDSIFLVIGESGDYSNYMTWVAAAYLSEAEAKIEKIQAWHKYRRVMFSGWCKAKRKLCERQYGHTKYWRLTKKQQEELLSWPKPSSSHSADKYSVLKIPTGVIGDYWPT